jgi:LuxR family transcriptional regulator, activator of conjugal transfer of Ti plasmids
MDFISDQTVTFIESVQKATTTEELKRILEGTLATLGVRYFTLYEFTGSTEEGVLGNYPEEWGERYAEKRYEYLDPVALKLFRERQGFFWDCKRFEAEGKLKGGSKDVFHEGSDFGLREGYAYLISDHFGQTALTSFCSDRIERDPKMLSAMHLISLYMHGKYKALATAAAVPQDAPHLTPRERECLRWAGHGKTNWEIAKILDVKETTVETHIQNAKRKFNVSSKMLAVIRSVQSGVLHL